MTYSRARGSRAMYVAFEKESNAKGKLNFGSERAL
jgi:hypothetical protein